jgi:hypothetical protein
VKSGLQRDELALAGVGFGQAHRALDGLRAAVAEKRLLQRAGRDLRQALGQVGHRGHVVNIGAAMHELLDLLLGRVGYARMHVAGVHYRDAGEQIGVGLAVCRGHGGAARALHHHRLEGLDEAGIDVALILLDRVQGSSSSAIGYWLLAEAKS